MTKYLLYLLPTYNELYFTALHDILDLTKKGHFQIACSKYFDAVHNGDHGLGINHPNQYFEESQKVLKGEIKPEQKVKIKSEMKVKKETNGIENMDLDEITE